MRFSLRTIFAALVLLTAGVPAAAHHPGSAQELNELLGDREKFFQPVGKPAPEFALADSQGRPVRLADFRGKTVVLFFIYLSCPDVCPLHADLIAEVQEKINRTPMADQVRFVGITTDPENDSPQVMRDYGPLHGLDGANWTLLTTRAGQPEDATRKLAAAYGHKFVTTESGYQVHGVVTQVIDRDGVWRANFHGLRFDPTNLALYLNALVNDVHAPGGRGRKGLWDRIRALF